MTKQDGWGVTMCIGWLLAVIALGMIFNTATSLLAIGVTMLILGICGVSEYSE